MNPYLEPYREGVTTEGPCLTSPYLDGDAYPGIDPYLECPPYGEQTGAFRDVPCNGAPPRPLTVTHVGPCLLRGGAEQWLIDLLRFLDPKRLRILKTIVTEPDRIDPVFAAEVRVPIETGQAESVRRAARESDILLAWGIELNAWLADCRPRLCIFVAHGDGDWTRSLL